MPYPIVLFTYKGACAREGEINAENADLKRLGYVAL